MNEIQKEIEKKVRRIKDNPNHKNKGRLTYEEFKDLKRKVRNKDKNRRDLGRSMIRFKEGFYVQKGSFMQTYYGCNTCPFKERCSKYPHANGGCADRYKFIADYLKRWKGDSIPLMEELAVVNELVATEQYEKDIKKTGEPSMMYVALRKLANDFHVHTQKQKLGSKVKIEKELTFKDVRDKIFEYVDIKPEDGKDNKSDS